MGKFYELFVFLDTIMCVKSAARDYTWELRLGITQNIVAKSCEKNRLL